MNRIRFCLTICLLLLMLPACAKSEDAVSVSVNYESGIEYNEISSFSIGGGALLDDIEILNRELLISDVNNDRIIILNLEDNSIRNLGKSGNGEGEFVRPRGIASDDNKNIYVVDSGNNRIQKFDSALGFIESFDCNNIKISGTEEFINSIAVKDDIIYLTTKTFDSKKNGIYIIDMNNGNKKPVKLTGDCIGFLAQDDENVYFLNAFIIERDGNATRIRTGGAGMYVIQGKQIIQRYTFDNLLAPVGVCRNEDKLYIASKGRNGIIELDLHENSGEQVLSRDIATAEIGSLSISEDGKLYLLDVINSKVLVLEMQ